MTFDTAETVLLESFEVRPTFDITVPSAKIPSPFTPFGVS